MHELRETFQKLIINLTVEAGYKILHDDPTICGLVSHGVDFAILFRMGFSSLLFYDISQMWLRND